MTKTILDYPLVVPEGTDYLLIQRGSSYYRIALADTVASTGASLSGHGEPEGVQAAAAGSTYVDLDTGAFYWKTADGLSGWKP
jgi:hypothetical protein